MTKWMFGQGKHFLTTITKANEATYGMRVIPPQDFKKIEDKLKDIFTKDEDKAWSIYFTLESSHLLSEQTLDSITKIYNASEKSGMSKEEISEKLRAIWDFDGKNCIQLGVTPEELSSLYDKGKEVFKACISWQGQRCIEHGVKITEMADIYIQDKEKFTMLTGYRYYDRPSSLSIPPAAHICYECGVTMKELSAIYDGDKTKDKSTFVELTRYMLYDRQLDGHHNALLLGSTHPKYKPDMLSPQELSAVRTRLKSEFDKIKGVQDTDKLKALYQFSSEGYGYHVFKNDKMERLTLDEAVTLDTTVLNELKRSDTVLRYVELDDLQKIGLDKLRILQTSQNTLLGTLALDLDTRAMKIACMIGGHDYYGYDTSTQSQKTVAEGISAYMATHSIDECRNHKETIIKTLSEIRDPQKIDRKQAIEIADRLLEEPFKFDWSNKTKSLKQLVSHVTRSIGDSLGMHREVISAAKAIGDDIRKINDKIVSTSERREKQWRKELERPR